MFLFSFLFLVFDCVSAKGRQTSFDVANGGGRNWVRKIRVRQTTTYMEYGKYAYAKLNI